jgi:hypothetical protein
MAYRMLVSVALVCTATLLSGQQPPVRKSVDFRNFTFLFPNGELNSVPSKLAWMSLNVKSTGTLVNGRYDFDKADPSAGPSVILDRVLYGYLTSAMQLDAVVVLGYHTGGTAYWEYAYAFSLASGEPKLVGWFRAGSRADFGLYRVDVGNRSLTIDLFDPAQRTADCCSDGFVRTQYDFRNGYFVQREPQEFGKIEESKPATGNRLNR